MIDVATGGDPRCPRVVRISLGRAHSPGGGIGGGEVRAGLDVVCRGAFRGVWRCHPSMAEERGCSGDWGDLVTTVRRESAAIYADPTASVGERVADLMARMTREEKLAQLGSAWAFSVIEGGRFSAERARTVLRHGLGT